MEPVVTVNLAGNAYQLDQSAHTALRAYLDAAAAALADNPDKAEILHDLEQAIADKASAYLSAYKNVIGAGEMAQIIAQMGPVEGARDSAAGGADADPPRTPRSARRLYRIRDRNSVTGVSAGLAAYFELDVSLIRVMWIFGVLITGGFLLVPYIILMFWMPLASTPEEIASAHGAPFNAQDVIEQAKRNFDEFAEVGANSWRSWRAEARHARRQARRAEARAFAQSAPPPPSGPVSAVSRVFGGLFAFVFAIIGVALLVAFIFTLFSLITAGAVLGWSPPSSVPLWLAIVLACIAYAALAGPVGALQSASFSAFSGQHRPFGAPGDGGFGGILMLIIVGWLFYTYVPEARDWMEFTYEQIRVFFASLPTPDR